MLCVGRPQLPLVLKDLSMHLPAGTKVGVVGRTGAGKSSLAALLFRLVDPASGRVEIDGYDTAAVGLSALRRGITVIPQDPTLMEVCPDRDICGMSSWDVAWVW